MSAGEFGGVSRRGAHRARQFGCSAVRFGVLALALAFAAACSSTCNLRNPPPEYASVSLPDTRGRTVTPGVVEHDLAHVVVFTALECPIANGYAPEIEAITRAYATNGVRTYLVFVDRDATAEKVKAHVQEYSLSAAALLDGEHALANALRATVTPECFVLTRAGVAYRGRIDDQYVALGKKRSVVTSHDLRDALDQLLATGAPAVISTTAIGCRIE